MDPADRRIICKVCLRQYARYTCPRCNTGYCSLPCYKQHGERCTESFYKEQAEGELRSVRAGDEQRRVMMDILKRFQQQQLEAEEQQQLLLEEMGGLGVPAEELGGDGDEEEEEEGEGEEESDSEGGGRGGGEGGGGGGGGGWGPLASLLSEDTRERLMRKAADSGGEDRWEVEEEDLTPDEWRAFQRAVALGQLCGAVEPWRPWWTSAEARELTLTATGQRKVTVLPAAAAAAAAGDGAECGSGETSLGGSDGGGGVLPPPPPERLPPLSSLTRAAPSPLLTWHLVELLYSYCHVMRRFNGEWAHDPGAAAAILLSLTDVLAVVPAPAGRRNPQLRSGPTAAAVSSSAAAAAAAAGGTVGAPGSAEGDEEDGEAATRLPRTAAEACMHGVERACVPPIGTSKDRPYAVSVLYDVAALLENGRSSVLLALEDSRRLVMATAAGVDAVTAAATAASTAHGSADRKGPRLRQRANMAEAAGGCSKGPGGRDGAAAMPVPSKAERVQLAAAERKLWFFLVWANELSEEQYEHLAEMVSAEWQMLHATVVVGAGGTQGQAGTGAGVGIVSGRHMGGPPRDPIRKSS
ncbi:hypothetical protein Vretimale_12226 [Volvox reticuliferus]|uniref:HIT-type domain-containing protein n=1 Tax=Volvox reticuliferus TaxID=1737510 RepID=A0A8J4LSA6_9CHLO|nr:hypothetical protein Vretifemale_8863 [Volvox reticuliferus]GIM08158.1 hypothetical protein Vretimale_12226 [Volvox reticuliferus]